MGPLQSRLYNQKKPLYGDQTPVKGHLAGVKYFPEKHVLDLLFKGFVRRGTQNEPDISKRLNLRDILITILLHGGAVRVSEPFHLYIHDVMADPIDSEISLVRIYHPGKVRSAGLV